MSSSAEENAQQLTELRDKLFFAYCFINVLWAVISIAVKQANFAVPLPDSWVPSSCGGNLGGNETITTPLVVNERNNGNITGSLEEDFTVEPLSLFFLLFYVIVMTIQFITMMWHRLSTFQHYMAYLNVSTLYKSIKTTKTYDIIKLSKMFI